MKDDSDSWPVIIGGLGLCIFMIAGFIFLIVIVFAFYGAIFGAIGAGAYLIFKLMIGLFA